MEQENNYQSRENWRFVSSGSVYTAAELPNGIIVTGGSSWLRRSTPFNQETRNSPGELVVLPDQERIVLPSMVNAVVPTPSGVFIGCKKGEQALNLFSTNMELLQTANDPIGDGVYLSVFDQQRNNVLATTRTGSLIALSPDNLEITQRVPLASSRLWALYSSAGTGNIYSGDYAGNVYVVNENFQLHQSFNMLESLHSSMPEEQKVWDPSIWGITETANHEIVISTRWGQITWFDQQDTLTPTRSIVLTEEITQLETIPNTNTLLVGTRSGKLLRLTERNSCTEELLFIPPAFQSDNSVWTISFTDNGDALVCFADGQVVNLGI